MQGLRPPPSQNPNEGIELIGRFANNKAALYKKIRPRMREVDVEVVRKDADDSRPEGFFGDFSNERFNRCFSSARGNMVTQVRWDKGTIDHRDLPIDAILRQP